jgi:hypothetical protein
MPPPYVSVKDIEHYQHYKHRNPPWVKLYYSLLDDPAFLALNEVQQCRYIKLIMLASRQMNCISTDPEYLGRVMRIPEQVDVTPLIDAGFLLASRKRSSSKMLAPPHENRSQSNRVTEKSRVEKDLSFAGPMEDTTSVPKEIQWGTPEALVALYNTETPDECPAVTRLSPARVKKAKAYLAAFPDERFWRDVCQQIHRSTFLRGLKSINGHSSFKADFDWLLTKGKDGSENCLKVYEGRYTDEGRR